MGYMPYHTLSTSRYRIAVSMAQVKKWVSCCPGTFETCGHSMGIKESHCRSHHTDPTFGITFLM